MRAISQTALSEFASGGLPRERSELVREIPILRVGSTIHDLGGLAIRSLARRKSDRLLERALRAGGWSRKNHAADGDRTRQATSCRSGVQAESTTGTRPRGGRWLNSLRTNRLTDPESSGPRKPPKAAGIASRDWRASLPASHTTANDGSVGASPSRINLCGAQRRHAGTSGDAPAAGPPSSLSLRSGAAALSLVGENVASLRI